MKLVVCTGTGTEVGKTWVSAAVLVALRAGGVSVAARKPAQSFVVGALTDAEVLAAATGEPTATVCPPGRWFELPMAPPMAAAKLGRPAFSIAGLVAELSWPEPPPDIGWIESAGGVRSPLAEDGDTVELCKAVSPHAVVLVADAGLGVINAARLAAGALQPWSVLVMLNRFDEADELHRLNRAWLVEREGFDVVSDVDELAARLAAD